MSIENKEAGKPYSPSNETEDRIKLIYDRFDVCWNLHNQPFHYFDDLTLEEYINESMRENNAYLPAQSDQDKKRKSNLKAPDVMNKVIAVVTFVASQRMRAEATARTKTKLVDKKLSRVLNAYLDYFADKERADLKFLLFALEVVQKGTAFMQETWDYRIRPVKDLVTQNVETGEMTWQENERIESDAPVVKVLPVEDVYFPNFYEWDIQKQPYLVIREIIHRDIFDQRYGNYTNADYVKSRGDFAPAERESNVFFYQNWAGRTDDDFIEVLHYYDKDQDLYNVIANGVFLLPKLESPIPFDHKDYPISSSIGQFMGADFAYGKPLAQRIISLSHLKTTMWRLIADRTIASLIPTFITSFNDEIEESSYGPLRRIQVTDPTRMRELQVQSVSPADLQVQDRLTAEIDAATLDKSMSGQVSDQTATAILQARQTSIQNLGMLVQMLGYMVYEQTKQRISNILQFLPSPNPLKDSKGRFKYKEVSLENQVLSDGTNGVLIIRLVPNAKGVPSEEKRREELQKAGVNAEIFYLTPNNLQDIDFKIKIIPNSSIPETKALRKAMAIEYVNTVMSNPQLAPLLNPEKVLDYLNEAFDVNTEDMKAQPQEQPGQQDMIMQAIQRAQGGEAGAKPNSPLVQQLAGTQQPGARQLLEMPANA